MYFYKEIGSLYRPVVYTYNSSIYYPHRTILHVWLAGSRQLRWFPANTSIQGRLFILAFRRFHFHHEHGKRFFFLGGVWANPLFSIYRRIFYFVCPLRHIHYKFHSEKYKKGKKGRGKIILDSIVKSFINFLYVTNPLILLYCSIFQNIPKLTGATD